jgi:hypothetical protein
MLRKEMAPFSYWNAGLPDGVFSYQRSQFENILVTLRVDIVGVFYVHLE